MKNNSRLPTMGHIASIAAGAALAGCGLALAAPALPTGAAAEINANRLLIVDCLLPGQVRQLGGQMTY